MIHEQPENNKITRDMIRTVITSKPEKLDKIYEKARQIQKNHDKKTGLETNIYYPAVYAPADNCPTCGFRTPESKREYNPLYIQKTVEYKLRGIKQHPIKAVNCFNRGPYRIHEVNLLLKTITEYNTDINIKLEKLTDYEKIENKKTINGIILDYTNTTYLPDNPKPDEIYKKTRNTLKKIHQTNNNLNIIYELPINYNENYKHMTKTLQNLIKINPETIQITGYDPFYDTPEEYNPQYTQEYLNKIITLTRILLPECEIKLQYATNNNNRTDQNIKQGINTITGVYTNKNTKQYNIDKIIKHIPRE